MEYEILLMDRAVDLEDEVRKRILEGWEPIGGPTLTIDDGMRNWVQAVIRRPVVYHVPSVWTITTTGSGSDGG